jgi:hypothetical protein
MQKMYSLFLFHADSLWRGYEMEKAAVSRTTRKYPSTGCVPYRYKLPVHVACCSACACITAAYSGTCACGPLWGFHFHLQHLHVHRHGCQNLVYPMLRLHIRPRESTSFRLIAPRIKYSVSINRRGSSSTLTLRPLWIVATCACMQLVSGNHHHVHNLVSGLTVHGRTD